GEGPEARTGGQPRDELVHSGGVGRGQLLREADDGGPGGMHLGHASMLPSIGVPPRRPGLPGYRSRDMSDGGETMPRAAGTVHVVGAGPVGSFITALLQTIPGQRVCLYEKRSEYTRTRMVQLAPYLVADSIESYLADQLDGQNVAAIFDSAELEYRMAYRRRVAPDLRALLDEWTLGFVPINTIERSLTELVERRGTGTVE